MASRVLFKRNSNSGVVPTPDKLVQGELAMNTADGKVFLKKEDNTVLDITKTIFDKDTSITADESSGTPSITAKVNNDTKFYVDTNGTEFVKPITMRSAGGVTNGISFNDSTNANSVTIKGPDNADFSYEVKLPPFQPIDRSTLALDGQGNLEWSSPDSFGGNRVYVSDRKGDDNNDGINAPVRSLKRGAQIAASLGLRPLTDPGEGKYNAKRLLEANRSFIQSQVIKWIDANFVNFTYDQAKCARDLGIIIDAVALDFTLGTNYKSVVAGRAYRRANAYTVILDQILQTKYSILKAQEVGLSSINNATALTRYNAAFSEIVDILENDVGDDSTDAIVFPTPGSASSEEVAAKDKLQANKNFLKEEVIAWINTNYSDFTYDTAKCARDTGLLLDAAGYDMVLNTNYNAVVAGRSYLRANSSYLQDNQKMQTMAAFNYAKDQALLSVVGDATAVQRVELAFGEILDIINNGVGDASTDAIVFTAPVGVERNKIDARDQLQANKQFIADEVTAFINKNFVGYTYAGGVQTTCERDLGIIIDGAGYDAALGTNYNSVTAGLSYQRANSSYVQSGQNLQTLAGILYAQSLAEAAVSANGTALNRVTAAFNEVVDIFQNGVESTTVSADALTFSNPTNAAPDVIDAKNQLIANREFLKAEISAFINEQFGNYEYTAPIQSTCERDVGLILDAAVYDAVLGTNYNAVTAGLAYTRANSAYVLSDQKTETIGGIQKSLELALGYSKNSTFESRYSAAINEVVDIIQNGASSANGIIYTIPGNASLDVVAAQTQLRQNRSFITSEITAYIDTEFLGYKYSAAIQAKCERDIGFITDAAAYDAALGTNYNAVTAGLAYQRNNSDYVTSQQKIQTIAGIQQSLATALTISTDATFETRYTAAINEVIDIIQNGVQSTSASADALVFPSPTGILQDKVDAKNQLVQNKAFIQAEIVAFVESNSPPVDIDTNICGRDTGYILDAICYDIMYGGNSATIQAATAYFVGAVAVIPRAYDIQKTIEAYEHLKLVVRDVIKGVTITPTSGNSLTQNTSGGTATNTEADSIDTLIDIINNAIDNDGVVPSTVYPSISWTAAGLQADHTAVLAAKTTIKTAVSNFILDNFDDFYYDSAKCARDTGYIVDALTYDVLYGGNSATIRNALAYFVGTTSQLGSGQGLITQYAYERLQSVVSDIILGNTVTASSGNTVTQITLGSVGTSAETATATDLIQIIVDVIAAGSTSGLPTTEYPDTSWATPAYIEDQYIVLDAKSAIQTATSAYITATFSNVYEYTPSVQATCERDVEYILRASAYDAALGTNYNAVTAGLAYTRANSAYVLSNQNLQTKSGINKAKDLALTFTSDVTFEANFANAFTEVVDVLINGADNADTLSFPDPVGASANVVNAKNRLINNRAFIQSEITAYINSTYVGTAQPGAYEYTAPIQAKCERDVGYIIDAATYDMVLGTNYNAVTAGLAYTRANSAYVLSDQKTETIAAINQSRILAAPYLADSNSLARYNAAVNEVVDILTNGVSAANAITFPNPTLVNPNWIDAKNQLIANRGFIAEEIVAWVEANKGVGYTYDQAKCRRDTEYIVDALTYDMLYGGNSATVRAADAYFVGAVSQLGLDQQTTTANAFGRLKTVISNIVQGTTVTKTSGNRFKQDILTATATSTEATFLSGLVDIVINVINAGNTSGLPTVVYPTTTWATTGLNTAKTAVQAGKATIISGTSSYIQTNLAGYRYDAALCARDVGYIVDALTYDILYGGNSATVRNADAYFVGTSTAQLGANQATITADAYARLQTVVGQIIQGTTVTKSTGNTATQNSTGSNATGTESTILSNLIQVIVDVIVAGNKTGLPSVTYPSLTWTDDNYEVDHAAVISNISTIQTGVSNYITQKFDNFSYNASVCARDVGFIVDALTYDILYGGNSASIKVAGAYFDGTGAQLGTDQDVITIYAYNHLKDIVGQVVRGVTIDKSRGNIYTQSTTNGNATTSEASALATLINYTIDVITAGTKSGLPAPSNPSLTWVNANVLAARNALNTAKPTIITNTSTYLFNTFDSFTYDQAKCERDVGYIVDALTYDLLYGGNTAMRTAASAYWTGAVTQVPDQIFQTSKAFEHMAVVVDKVIRGLPFTVSTGFSGATQDYTTYGAAANSDVVAAASLLGIVSDVVTQGASGLPAVVAPDVSWSATGLKNARLELVADRQSIIDGTINFVKTQYQDFLYDEVRCSRDVGYIIDGLSYDILYGGNTATRDSALAYWANATTQVPGQQTVTSLANDRLAYLVDKVVQGTPILDVYQTAVTQITSGSNASTVEAATLTSLIGIISTAITSGVGTVPAAVDPDTSWVSGAITADTAAFRVTNRTAIINAVIAYIADTFTGFVYDSATCSRDTGLILDAVVLDFILGGNERSVEAGLAYYEYGNTSAALVVNEQLFETAEANKYAKRIAKQIIQNQTISPFFTPLAGEPVQKFFPTISGAAALNDVETLFNTVIDIFSGNPAPTVVPNRFQQVPITISVAAGDFYIDNPIIIPDLCSVVGDSLRSVVVRPLNAGKDMFRIRNGAYMTGFTFRDGLDANLVPSYTFNWCVAFDDPDDSTVDRQGYFGLRRNKPQISLSPYIQNCSIISFLGGNGIWVDGNKIRDPNISPPGFEIEQENPVEGPQPPQGKSMVANAFTMVSFGGTGWLVSNDGYAQIVSCFQIFCLNGSYAQSGGYLSITNSATNFGVYALRSSGFSPNAFNFDRGYVAATGTSGGRISLTTLGTEREPIAQYVLKFRNASTDADVTSNFKTASTEFSFDSTAFNAIAGRTGTITNIAGSGPYTATLTNVNTTGIVTGKYLTKTAGEGTLGSVTTVTAVRAGANEIDITSNGVITAGTGALTFAVGGAVNTLTNVVTIPDHGLLNGDSVYYYVDIAVPGNTSVLGLIDNGIYFTKVLSANTIQLFNDNGLAYVADIQTGGIGTHRIAKNVEEFFVEKILSSHNSYQTLTLPESTPDYVFGVGTPITGTTGAFTNNAYVLSWTPATRELVVSNQLTTVGEEQQRIKFTALSTITTDQSPSPFTGIPVSDVVDRSDLYTTVFTTNSTRTASEILNPSGTIGFKCNFHRPSIVNSSSHTWEYAGSGTDYNALPQNGGTTILAYQQYTELPGRVYSSGTNEIGDFLVGDFIKAENNTGKITFRTEVTVGQLNVLRLSLSSIEISSISNDTGLGDNEIGGASDSRLTTQKAIRSFINNRLGNVLDKNVSTNAVAGALVQLNSSGQINVDLIPPLRGVTTYATTTFGGRLLLSEKIPTVEVFNGDNASETYQQQTLTLTGGTLTAVVGDLITQNGTTGSGRVKEAVTGGTSVTLYGVTGTFSEDNAAQTIRKNGTTVTGVYPNALTTVSEIVDNYFLNNDTSSQFLLLDGPGYNFTVGGTITSAIGLAQGEITEYRPGVLYGLNLSSLIGGSLYTPVSGSATYTNIALTNISGTGTGARADITVTNGAVTDVTIVSGGSGYTTGSVLSASSATIGGTGSGFQINANRADTRLYVNLIGNKTKFNASSAVNDYFEDNNAPVVTISNLATFTTFSFNSVSVGGGGDVNTSTSRITLTGHGLTNGDVLIYSNQANTSVGGLTNNRGYFVKVIDLNTVELYSNYALGAADQVLLTASSTGTHTLTRNAVAIGSTSLSFFYKAAHGFTAGTPVLVEGADLPAGLNTGAYYFVGSVSTNTFTLHTTRANALASISGATLSKVAVTDVGSGSATLTVQNVAFSATVNDSSKLSANWGTVSVSSLDASNIVSGVLASSRLASAGTANTQTFLRGDSSWSYAVQGIRKNAGSSISLSGDSYTDGGDTVYFNQPILDVDKVDGDSGTPNFTNLGVAAFDKSQFAVGKPVNIPADTGNVSIKPGVIDAGFLSGQPGTYYTNPDNLSKVVPVLKGGTGLTTYLEGDLLYAGAGGSLTQLGIGGISTVLSSNGTVPSWSSDLNVAGSVTTGTGVFNGNVAATNTTSGSLQVTGGAGITQNLYVGGSLSVSGSINFNSSLSITGDNAVITLSPGGSGTVSIQPAGVTTLGTLGVQTTLVGNLSATGNQQTINFSPTGTNSAITINSAGSLTLGAAASGGINVTTNITSAGDIAVNGGDITTTATTFNLIDATATTVNFAGAATNLTMGANNSGTTTVRNNLTVNGDLTVSGTNTTINATSVTIRDNAIQLANINTPTNAAADGGGIILKGTTDHTLLWDLTNTNWTSSEHLNIATGKSFKINNAVVLNATTLGSAVVNSSLTGLGTVTSGTWNAGVITGAYGGTGVNNGTKTITLGGNLTTTGAFNTSIAVTNTTSVTLPTSGTLIGSNDTGTVSNNMLAGSIPNSKLANSSITLNGSLVNLGDNVTVTASLANNLTVGTGLQLDSGTTFNGGAARTISITSAVATLTGTQTFTNKTFTDASTLFQDDVDNTKKMAFQLSSVSANTTRTLTVPNVDGTIVTTGDTGSVTNTMLAGSIANAKLANSTISGIALGSNLNSLTAGSFLTWSVGTTFNGSAASTLAVNATNANTGSTVVARDASGNFSAGTITAALSGLATSATNIRVTATDYAGSTASSANTVALRDASSDIYANLFRGTATTARYADLAENYLGDVKYEAGTVVMFGGDAEVTLATDGTRCVAGVVSTNPAHLMNEGLQGETVAAIALQGRVPCKVVGKIRKGDMLVAAGNGYARAEEDPKMGQVIGKALEDFDGESGVIEVVVGRM